MKKHTIPRKLSLVKFDMGNSPESDWKYYPFAEHDHFIFMGEIPNMPEHCVIVNVKTGQVFSCYHTDNFVELTEDEV